MTKLTALRFSFCGVAVLAFFIAHFCFEVYARISIGGDTFGHAVDQTLHYARVQLIGTLMLLAPFVAVAWVSASLGVKRSVRAGALLFGAGALLLGAMYFVGHIASEEYMTNEKWTAAALSVGLLPFKSIPVVLVLWWLAHRATRKLSA